MYAAARGGEGIASDPLAVTGQYGPVLTPSKARELAAELARAATSWSPSASTSSPYRMSDEPVIGRPDSHEPDPDTERACYRCML